MPPERYERRPVRAVPIQYGCRLDDFRFYRSGGMLFLNLSMCAKVRFISPGHVRATTPYARFDRCLRGSRANRKKLRRAFFACFGWPNTVRAKVLGWPIDFRSQTSCGLCHRAKGPAQRACGLSWSSVPPSAQDIKSVPKGVAFVSF